jgi:hypothetical protein
MLPLEGLPAEEGLLVECSRRVLNERKILDMAYEVVDWWRVFDYESKHMLLTVTHALKGHEGIVPEDVSGRMLERYDTLIHHSARQHLEAFRIASVFRGSGIDVALLKGLHMQLSYYTPDYIRPVSDIDFLVREQQLEAAIDALKNEGYSPPPAEKRGRRFWSRYGHHVQYFDDKKCTLIELHWSLAKRYSPFTIDVREVWADASPAVKGEGAYVLSPEHLLIHLCLNMSFGGFMHVAPLRSICDIDRAVSRDSGRRYWEVIVDTCLRWGCQAFAYMPLKLACDFFQTAVPEEVLDELRGKSPRRHLAWVSSRPAERILMDVVNSYTARDYLSEILLANGTSNRLGIVFRPLGGAIMSV